jgi:hypothetical protein
MDDSTTRSGPGRPGGDRSTARPLLPIGDAAERLGISTDAIRRRIHRGTLHGEKIGGIWHVAVPAAHDVHTRQAAGAEPIPPGDRPGGNRAESGPDRAATGEATGALSALIDAQRDEIAYLRAALSEEQEARRRADTIILELSRRPVALPADVDAAVSDLQGPQATKPAETTDHPSSWLARLWRQMTGR